MMLLGKVVASPGLLSAGARLRYRMDFPILYTVRSSLDEALSPL